MLRREHSQRCPHSIYCGGAGVPAAGTRARQAQGDETMMGVALVGWHRLSVPVPILDPAGGSDRVLGRPATAGESPPRRRQPGTRGPAGGRPNGPAGEPGRHAVGNAGGTAGLAAAGTRLVPQRPTAGRVRQDGGSADPGSGNRRRPAARRDSDGNRGEHARRRDRESHRTSGQGASQLYGIGLHAGWHAAAAEQRRRGSEGLRRGARRDRERGAQHPAAARQMHRAARRKFRPAWPARRTVSGSTCAAICPTRCWNWTRIPARCCARGTSAWRRMTWCSPADERTCRTGAAAGRSRAI